MIPLSTIQTYLLRCDTQPRRVPSHKSLCEHSHKTCILMMKMAPAPLPQVRCPYSEGSGSMGPTSRPSSRNGQQRSLRMFLAVAELTDDSYQPRNTPNKRQKSDTGHIKPRSDKYARELELDRKAPTKCRNRQKAFIERLQYRSKREEEKTHIQTSLVSALHDEEYADCELPEWLVE